jgi:hypothetical protein
MHFTYRKDSNIASARNRLPALGLQVSAHAQVPSASIANAEAPKLLEYFFIGVVCPPPERCRCGAFNQIVISPESAARPGLFTPGFFDRR